MDGRFAKPGYNGDQLATSVWVEDGAGWFVTTNQRGDVLLDRGRYVLA
jgi:hypothetical protein